MFCRTPYNSQMNEHMKYCWPALAAKKISPLVSKLARPLLLWGLVMSLLPGSLLAQAFSYEQAYPGGELCERASE